jgi:hypothetical protein
MRNNRSYFMRRAAQERSAASQASDVKAREAHEKMARRYRELVASAAEAQAETVTQAN